MNHPGNRTEVIKSSPGQIWMRKEKGRKIDEKTMITVGKK